MPVHKTALLTQAMSPKVPDEYISNELAMKRVFWPQSSSCLTNKAITKDESQHVNINEFIFLKPNKMKYCGYKLNWVEKHLPRVVQCHLNGRIYHCESMAF